MPIVIATGFDTRELVREFENDKNTCVLGKPFDVPGCRVMPFRAECFAKGRRFSLARIAERI